MKKVFWVVLVCLALLGSFGVGNVFAGSNSVPQQLEIFANSKTINKTCIKKSPFDYIPCSGYIPKGRYILVYIYTVEKYYKVAYVEPFSSTIYPPKGVVGWVKQTDIDYLCCK